jgi:hypothetical protein
MTLINSSSFFHYTKRKKSLLGILRNGFRFSYSYEIFDEIVAHSDNDKFFPMSHLLEPEPEPVGIAFPMVCFCDIPLMRASQHRKRYGNYCIGLDKDATLKQWSPIMNPVYYVNSFWVDNLYEKLAFHKRSLATLVKKDKEFITEIENASQDALPELAKKAKQYMKTAQEYYEFGYTLEQLLRLTKPCVGKDKKGKSVNFYDEREWRVFLNYKQREKTDVHYGLTREEYDKNRPEWNKAIESDYLTFEKCMPSEVISHIIVPEEKDVPAVIGAIKSETHILGKEISLFDPNIKDLLISKVTSFERIENDF